MKRAKKSSTRPFHLIFFPLFLGGGGGIGLAAVEENIVQGGREMGEWYIRSQKDPTELSVYGSMCVSADCRDAGVGVVLCIYESAATFLWVHHNLIIQSK